MIIYSDWLWRIFCVVYFWCCICWPPHILIVVSLLSQYIYIVCVLYFKLFSSSSLVQCYSTYFLTLCNCLIVITNYKYEYLLNIYEWSIREIVNKLHMFNSWLSHSFVITNAHNTNICIFTICKYVVKVFPLWL